MKKLEKLHNVKLIRGWILSGPGPARFGYYRVDPCKLTWLGRTLKEVSRSLS